MHRFPLWAAALPLGLVLAAGGCGGDGGGKAAERVGEPAETGAAMEGLTPEQIRAAAEPMSPAVAESLGIVDTTIHVESFPGESGRSAPPAPDTSGR